MFGKDVGFILYVCSLLRIFLKLLDNGGKTKEIVHQVIDTVGPTVGCAASRKEAFTCQTQAFDLIARTLTLKYSWSYFKGRLIF